MENQNCIYLVIFLGTLWIIINIIMNKRDENQRKNRIRSSHNFRGEGKTFLVIYKHGHKGIDHYLKTYLKRSELEGTITVSKSVITFICPWTRTEQKFKLSWLEVKGSSFHFDENISSHPTV